MLWEASGWTGRAPCARCFSFLFNSKFHTRGCVCSRTCSSLTDSDDVWNCVCHMLGQPTPPECVGGDTLHSEWHAAGCPGLSRGSGGDHTMMCFMGINVDTHSSPYSTPATPETFGLVECRASSHFFCVHPFVFGLTVGPPLLPARSRMWTPASVSWTPEEWTYKGSQQKVRRKRVTQGPS